MKLASIEKVAESVKHPNADKLSVVRILGYECVTKLDEFKAGDFVVFIQPDTILPDGKEWAVFFKAKSNRVKAIRLRNVWSQGIALSPATVGYVGPLEAGIEVSEAIGVTKYEPPQPQDPAARRASIFPKTDEERWENIPDIPYGETVDVTLKIDGQSFTAYCIRNELGEFETGVCGRTLEFKTESDNSFTRNFKALELDKKLRSLGTEIAIRGEQYGQGIQASEHNPWAREIPSVAFYSVYLPLERRYARKGDPFYAYDFVPTLGLRTCPVVERDVVLTKELVLKYSEGLKLLDGEPFEGVVIQHKAGSFKVINKWYDASK